MTVVCIVGSVNIDEEKARPIIHSLIDFYNKYSHNTVIISGGAKGVDTIVEEEANKLLVPFVIFKPKEERWSSYKERNWSMAYACDKLFRIKSKDSKTYGSGWTRDRAKEMGKYVEEIVI